MIITIVLTAAIAVVLMYVRVRFLDLMVKEIRSPFDFDETIARLTSSIGSRKGWHVFNVVDQGGEIIRNGGDDVGRITVLQYCHGALASRMFLADERKKISVFSPKTMSVYQKNDGATYVSMMNGELMLRLASGEMKEIIEDVSAEVKTIMSVFRKTPAAEPAGVNS
jgi:uncharacterized protein (DUF302 family)